MVRTKQDNFPISAQAIGIARLGITLKQLKRKLGTECKISSGVAFHG
jgi:hypothetical protein